ncbi:MAG: SUMF1/EgtB/PvdO family nonheme iron enzyme [candidate division Zixibacteria bacterium]|nr:SUMF1/EgtB/PvdO family nonheme iron enzyme [Candidatus Tariuqbacter arcticus]
MRKHSFTLIGILIPLILFSQIKQTELQEQLEKIENSLSSKKAEYQKVCLDYEEARKKTAESKLEYETTKDNYQRGSNNVDLIPAEEMVKLLNKYKSADQAYKNAQESEERLKIAKTKLFNDIKELEKQKKNIKIDILKNKADKFDEELTKPIWTEGYGESVLDEDKTIKECKRLALEYARRDAMDKGGKVLIEAVTEIKDFQITRDELKSKAKVQIIEQDNSGDYGKVKQEIVGNVMKFSVKVRVKLQSATKYNPYRAQIAEMKGERISSGSYIDAEDSYLEDNIEGPLPDMTFVPIPGGSFMMGSNDGDSREKPVHRVTIKPFKMQTTEVTQAQWKAVMGNNPSHFKGYNLPVEKVSWNDCQKFIRKLNQLDPGKGYRLPTEAEWEYACRAGTTTKYYSGNNESDLKRVAWYVGNSGIKTHPVGSKEPNTWGLYDTHGNVYEWCEDWYYNSYNGAPTDGRAWTSSSGSSRVPRGGCWSNYQNGCRSAARRGFVPDYRNNDTGFRLARSL